MLSPTPTGHGYPFRLQRSPAAWFALAFGVLGLGIHGSPTHAATIEWTGSNTDWNTSTSWNPNTSIAGQEGNNILLADATMPSETNIIDNANLITDYVVYDVFGSRTLRAGSPDDGISTLTLQGDGANPLLSMGAAANLSSTWTLLGLSNVGSNRQLRVVLDNAADTQGTFHVQNLGATLDLSTNISTTNSNVGITKTGTGTVVLSGNNSYAGPTLVNAGALRIQSNNALGTTAGGTTVAANAALQLQGGITVAGESLVISGGGISNGGALLNVSGNNEWTGNISTTGASARISSATGSTFNISGDINLAGSTLLLQGGGAGEISGDITGNSGITRSSTGTGNWVLSGENTYTGSTLIIQLLTVSGGQAIPDTGAVEFNLANSGILNLASSETIGSLATLSSWTGSVTLGSNTLTTGGNNTNTSFGGNISGAGGVTKVGTGNQTFSASNAYAGQTIIQGGTLTLGASGSIASSSDITVGTGATFNVSAVSGGWTLGSGQTLSGTGTVVGDATIAGNLNPGNSPGVLSFEDDLLMESTTATTMEILGLVRGDDYDGIDVGGTLGYDGSLTLDLGTTFGPGSYDFNLFDFFDTSGSFDSVDLTGDYTASLTNNSGVWTATTNAGNETWTFTQGTGALNVVVVPEPGAAALAFSALMGGMGVLAFVRSRRRRL